MKTQFFSFFGFVLLSIPLNSSSNEDGTMSAHQNENFYIVLNPCKHSLYFL